MYETVKLFSCKFVFKILFLPRQVCVTVIYNIVAIADLNHFLTYLHVEAFLVKRHAVSQIIQAIPQPGKMQAVKYGLPYHAKLYSLHFLSVFSFVAKDFVFPISHIISIIITICLLGIVRLPLSFSHSGNIRNPCIRPAIIPFS